MLPAVLWSILNLLGMTAGGVLLVLLLLCVVCHLLAPPPEDYAEVLAAIQRIHPDSSTAQVTDYLARTRPDVSPARVYGIVRDLELQGRIEAFTREGQFRRQSAADRRAGRPPTPLMFWKVVRTGSSGRKRRLLLAPLHALGASARVATD